MAAILGGVVGGGDARSLKARVAVEDVGHGLEGCGGVDEVAGFLASIAKIDACLVRVELGLATLAAAGEPARFVGVVGGADHVTIPRESSRNARTATCGTQPFPRARSRSTLKANPATTRPTSGSDSHQLDWQAVPRDRPGAGSASADVPSASPTRSPRPSASRRGLPPLPTPIDSPLRCGLIENPPQLASARSFGWQPLRSGSPLPGSSSAERDRRASRPSIAESATS